MPEKKRRQMKLNVLELLRERGVPSAKGVGEEDEEDLFAAEEEKKPKEGDEEEVVLPTPTNGPNLQPKKKKKLADYLA